MSPIRSRSLRVASLAAMCVGLIAGASASIDLQPTRSSPFDVELTGRLAGVPTGARRFVRWADLRALPVTTLTLEGEFVPGPQRLTVVFLTDLWSALPRDSGADTLFAICDDGYTSIFRAAFMQSARPFLVLEINGLGPDHWPPRGLAFNPAPCAILISAAVVPANATLLDAGHKKPWAVVALEVANFADRDRDSFTGRWAALSARAESGREIWINSCASCHPGPGATFGGTKSQRPFAVLAGLAADRPAYFKQYVRAPTSLTPSAKMEPHPHYSEAQLDALIAFVTAEPSSARATH